MKLKQMLNVKGYAFASTFVSLGGVLNGYDTGSIGAVTEMPAFLETFGHLSPTLRGFTVSLFMLASAIPSVFAGQIADKFGRLRVIMLGALIFLVGVILEAAAFDLRMFLAGRALCGIGQGVWLSNVSVYITEIAPSQSRGTFVSIPQFFAAFGVCIGYFTCYGSVDLGNSLAWRVPYIVQAGIAAMLASSCFFLPESPRWLLLHNKREEALRELDRLDFSKVEAEKDVLRPAEQTPVQIGLLEGLRMIFNRRYRARTILALFVLGTIQLCGIDGVLYYAPTLFAQAGLPSQQASFLASGVSAILMLVISVPAFLFADRWGRRVVTLVGGTILSTCMLIVGTLYAAGAVHTYGIARWVIIVCIFVFALTFCFTWAIVGKVYASEILPTHTRATANCVGMGMSFFANFLVAITTPIFLAHSAFGAYFLFGFITLATVVILALFMPETRGVSLENIGDVFGQRPVMRSWANLVRRAFSSARSNSDVTGSGLPSSAESVGLRHANDGIELEGLPRATGAEVEMHGALSTDGGTTRVLMTTP